MSFRNGKKYDRDMFNPLSYADQNHHRTRDDVNIRILSREEEIATTTSGSSLELTDISEYPQLPVIEIQQSTPVVFIRTSVETEQEVVVKKIIPKPKINTLKDELYKISKLFNNSQRVRLENDFKRWAFVYHEHIERYYLEFCPDKSIEIDDFALYLYNTC
jgi:hypothetical protein